MRLTGAVAAILLLVACLATAGCGGSDSTSGGAITASQLSKAEFDKKAEAICKKTYFDLKREYLKFVEGEDEEPFDDLDTINEYANDVILPIREREVEEWKALGAPKGDEKQIEAIVEAYEDAIAITEEDPPQAVTSPANPFNTVNHLGLEYGLEKCKY
jgi:hypothetical protein